MKLFRKLLFPFSLLYGVVTAIRNLLFQWGVLKSKSYDLPVICVGNLSTGGTGKSPMIEFLISFLKENHKLAVVSRGYKRKTKGFWEVFVNSTTFEVGDEPLQIKRKFPDTTVVVSESRQIGIENVESKVDVILLDDAFQHRKVTPSFSILLTSYGDLYSKDCVLPSGNLREPKWGASRADIVVVTKCPNDLAKSQMDSIRKSLKLKNHQSCYFSTIEYASEIKNTSSSISLEDLKVKTFTLVTGIANPFPLVEYLVAKGLEFTHKSFPDHHHFRTWEIEELDKDGCILTTEKDFVRLQPYIRKAELYFLPITVAFLDDQTQSFIDSVESRL